MGDKRNEGQKGIPTLRADILIGILRSGMWDARDKINGGRSLPFSRKAEGTGD